MWPSLPRRPPASRGGGEGATGADIAGPPLSPNLLWLLGGSLLVLGVGALVLLGVIFWTEQVARRPSSPMVYALLLLVLALMMIGFAVVRWGRASASRHPRWQRVHAALLLCFATYLLVLAFSMA